MQSSNTIQIDPFGNDYEKSELYQEFHIQFQRKRDCMLQNLKENLGNPYGGGNNGGTESKVKQIEKNNSKIHSKPSVRDPIRKIMKTNSRVVKYKRIENKKLLRILERIELDKPILMHDKLDIIWDKDSRKVSPQRAG